MKEFMYQVSSGYSGRLKARNRRKAKKELQFRYPNSEIFLLKDCSELFESYKYANKPFIRLKVGITD